jgi:hypothetical protein
MDHKRYDIGKILSNSENLQHEYINGKKWHSSMFFLVCDVPHTYVLPLTNPLHRLLGWPICQCPSFNKCLFYYKQTYLQSFTIILCTHYVVSGKITQRQKYVKIWKKINHYCHRPIYKQRNYLNLPKWNDGRFYFSFDEISPIKWYLVDINPPLLHPLLWCQASIGLASNYVVLNLQEGMITWMVFIWTKPKATKDGTTSTLLTKI